MDFRAPQNLAQGLKNHDKAALDWLLDSDIGSQLYTACEKACLGSLHDSEELFRRVLQRALKNTEALGDSAEVWLFGHFHVEWQRFAKLNPLLGASSAPLTFDWDRIEARQADDALLKLTPAEREIFILRFLFKYPLPLIRKITDGDEEELGALFHSSLKKVVPA